MCSFVSVEYYDFCKGANLKFSDGAKVDLRFAQNLPEDLDVSMCSSINLSYCDLNEVKELKFREGADVYLSGAKNLPEDLDFSMCSKVNLQGCDLSMVKELKFRDEEQRDKFLENAEKFDGKIVYVGDKGKSKNVSVNIGGGMEM